jgi:hypothetical protein
MKTIGRVDKADFPELSLVDIKVKVDTGAYTSSIHSHDIEEYTENDEQYIRFQILDPEHPLYRPEVYKTKRFRKKVIKNSFGVAEFRYIVKTNIVLFGEEYPIELSLSERSEMKYPVLLGRKLLNKRFVVDTSRKNLSFKLKKNQN